MSESSSTYSADSANVERIIARVFVILGGLFWVIMPAAAKTEALYSDLVYNQTELGDAVGSALIPLAFVVLVFVVGLFYERVAALILLAAAVATVVWGIVADWYGTGGIELWMTVGVFLISPMLIAAILFLLASRTHELKTHVQKSTSTPSVTA